MTNVVMLAKNRDRLTYQAVKSLKDNTDPAMYTLTLVDDGGDDPLSDQLIEWFQWHGEEAQPNWVTVRITPSKGIVGLARNIGIAFSEQYWGRGDWLYLSDNDVAFFPDWLPLMTNNMGMA